MVDDLRFFLFKQNLTKLINNFIFTEYIKIYIKLNNNREYSEKLHCLVMNYMILQQQNNT